MRPDDLMTENQALVKFYKEAILTYASNIKLPYVSMKDLEDQVKGINYCYNRLMELENERD